MNYRTLNADVCVFAAMMTTMFDSSIMERKHLFDAAYGVRQS